MKPLILNSFRFFKKMKQDKPGKIDVINNSEKVTIEKIHPENHQQPPYYERFISKHSRRNGDYWDLSGGLIGI